MAKVYAKTPGAEVWVSHFGPATETVPCLVPEAVGLELAAVADLRVEMEPAPAPAGKKKTAEAPAAAKVKED
jgi:hypothetical protein